MADACIFFFNKKTKESLINIGSGVEKTITEYAKFIIKKLKVNIKIKYVKPKLNGTPRKLLNSSTAINYGWRTKINLNSGFDKLINSYIKEIKNYQ